MNKTEFVHVRNAAVGFGAVAQVLTVEEVEEWLQMAERSLSLGPLLHPSEWLQAGDELQLEVKYMSAFLAFRRAIEELRPALMGESMRMLYRVAYAWGYFVGKHQARAMLYFLGNGWRN